jgi:enamine deaminase RidA (YjgF/YER057c/UK114 family)
MIERPTTKGLVHTPAFAQVLVATGSRTVCTSGQVSIDKEGNLIGAGNLSVQTTQAMRNSARLGSGGRDLRGHRQDHDARRQLPARASDRHHRRQEAVLGKPPTSALIGVAALALPLIEIEAVAVLDV